MIGRTVEIQRLLMAALRPLTGDRATGTALVAATSTDVRLPKGSFAYPVPESSAGVALVDDQRILFTTADAIASAVGVSVPMASLLGGSRHNALDAGTGLLWDPPVYGLEVRSSLSVGMSGGMDPPALAGFVKEIATYEDVTGQGRAQDFFNARLQGYAFPAILIVWESSAEGVLKGRNRKHRPDTWSIFIVSESWAGEAVRRNDGQHILDAVEALLSDRGVVDGRPFSDPPARVLERRKLSATESSVRALTLATWNTVETIDLRTMDIDGMTAEDFGALWLTSSYTFQSHPRDVADLWDVEPEELVVDGDMEAVGTDAWTEVGGALLSKVAGAPGGGGSQVLTVVRDGSLLSAAKQVILTVGRTYQVTGWYMTDGTCQAKVQNGNFGLALSTTSAAWVAFDATFKAQATSIDCINIANADGKAAFFDNVSVKDRTPVTETSPIVRVRMASYSQILGSFDEGFDDGFDV